jgi:hypothetical protein
MIESYQQQIVTGWQTIKLTKQPWTLAFISQPNRFAYKQMKLFQLPYLASWRRQQEKIHFYGRSFFWSTSQVQQDWVIKYHELINTRKSE